MNSKTFTVHATFIVLANITLLYFAIDNFESNTLPAMACIELVIGPLQFLTALILFLRKPNMNSWLYVYLIFAVILIGATFTVLKSDSITDLQYYLAPILIISYLVAHFFLYVVYLMKNQQKQPTSLL